VESTAADASRGEVLARISTALVQLHSQFYGKGPTKAKTYLVDDMVICVLRGGFTTIERTLIDRGESEAVHSLRRGFQRVMESEFTEVVEEALGRTVTGYMSQVRHDPEVAVEIFILEQADGSAAAGGGSWATAADGEAPDPR
jgi:uncharacterized protein YbcI